MHTRMPCSHPQSDGQSAKEHGSCEVPKATANLNYLIALILENTLLIRRQLALTWTMKDKAKSRQGAT